jgi:hypothetical protein
MARITLGEAARLQGLGKTTLARAIELARVHWKAPPLHGARQQRTHAPQQTTALFDHFVGPSEKTVEQHTMELLTKQRELPFRHIAYPLRCITADQVKVCTGDRFQDGCNTFLREKVPDSFFVTING